MQQKSFVGFIFELLPHFETRMCGTYQFTAVRCVFFCKLLLREAVTVHTNVVPFQNDIEVNLKC